MPLDANKIKMIIKRVFSKNSFIYFLFVTPAPSCQWEIKSVSREAAPTNSLTRGLSSAKGAQAKGRSQERIHATPDEVVKERSRIIVTYREISPADPYF